LSDEQETPEERRERLRQEELKGNPPSSIHGGGLPDLVGGLGWKTTGILIIVLVVGLILFLLFVK